MERRYSPPTPPDVRVRIRRFSELRYVRPTGEALLNATPMLRFLGVALQSDSQVDSRPHAQWAPAGSTGRLTLTGCRSLLDRVQHPISGDSRRLVDSAVISKSSGSDFKAGMCAYAAQPRSGLAPMMPTRILLVMMPC